LSAAGQGLKCRVHPRDAAIQTINALAQMPLNLAQLQGGGGAQEKRVAGHGVEVVKALLQLIEACVDLCKARIQRSADLPELD
jgi:hypothetical protein